MRWPPFGWTYPQLVLAILGVVIGVALVIAASTSGAAFGAYNPTWEGTSDLRSLADEETDTIVVTNTTRYEEVEANETVAIVLSPDRPYGPADSERIRQFVERGGTLVVADAHGPHSNGLLADVGATARFDGDPLRDERHHYRSPALPIATNTSDHPYVNDSAELTLNHGTAIDPGEATVVVRTSEYAYLDRDRDGELSGDETLASHPILTIEDVGDGRVLVIGDPSLFINAMLERPGNRAFATNLLAAHERTLFDTSHAADQPPLVLALLAIRDSAVLQLLLGTVLVAAFVVVERRPEAIAHVRDRLPYVRRPKGGGQRTGRLDEDELRAILAERYPDWDAERRDRIVTTITRRRRIGGNDERPR